MKPQLLISRARLDDLCLTVVDCPHSTPVWTENGALVLRSQNIRGGRLDLSTKSFTDEDHYRHRSRRAEVCAGDIVITREAPMGEVCMIPSGLRCCLGQRMVLLRPNALKCDGRYLLYALQSQHLQEQISWSEGTGSTVSNLRVPHLKALLVPTPSMKQQEEIGSVLGALDNKIEQNRRTAQALERLAQAIFRAWFVDFEPVKAKAAGATAFPSMPQLVFDALPTRFVASDIGPVPQGWEVLRLDGLLTLQRGFDLPKQSRSEGSHPILAASGLNGVHSEWKVKGPGVTTGRSGVLGQVFFVECNFWPLNTSLWVKEYKRSNSWHAYFLLQTLDLAQFNAGSAVPTLNRNHVHSLPIVAPPHSLLEAFERICSLIFSLDRQTRDESDKLAAMRDYLLPKLLSGAVRAAA